jgi:hypothetical protein
VALTLEAEVVADPADEGWKGARPVVLFLMDEAGL